MLSASLLTAGTLTTHRNPKNLTRHGITSFGLLDLAVRFAYSPAKTQERRRTLRAIVLRFTHGRRRDTLRGLGKASRRSLRCVVTGARRALGLRARSRHRPRGRGGGAADRLSSRPSLSQPRRRDTAIPDRGRRRRASRATQISQTLGEDFLLRRAAGNGIELMGVIAFRASPVWVLAALADVAGFGRQLIPEIAESLKKEGLLAPDGSFATMEQLLGGARAQLGSARGERQCAAARRRGLARGVAQVRGEARQLPAPQLPSAERRHARLARLACDGRARAALGVRSVVAARRVPPSASCRSGRACCRRRRPIVLASRRRGRIECAARALSAVAAANARGRVRPLRRAAAHAVHACGDRRVPPARETLTGKLLDRF